MDIESETTRFNSFVVDLYESIPQIEEAEFYDSIPEMEEDETYRLRFSKKRKFDKINSVIDKESIIYDSDSESEDNFEDYLSTEFRTWRRKYIKKYKIK
jgi:hypothetical protein